MGNMLVPVVGGRTIRWLLALLLSLTLLGCQKSTWLAAASYPEDRTLARQAIDDLIRNDRAAFSGKMHASLRPQLDAEIPKMRAALPSPRINATNLVDAAWMKQAWMSGIQARHARLLYELAGDDQWVLVQIDIVRTPSSVSITGFHVQTLDRPAAEINAFRLGDITLANGFVVVFGIAALVMTIIAIRRVWTSGLFKRRWLWIIGCLLGVGKISTLWASGQLYFTPTFFQFLSVGATSAGFLAPWQFSFSIPAIAIWVLVLHHRRRADPPSHAVEETR